MRLLAFDTETYLIQPTEKAPKPVCCSWYDREKAWLTYPGEVSTAAMFADPSNLFVGQNIPYDLVLMMRWHPDLIPDIMRALDEGRVFDTAMRERMTHLAQHGSRGFNMFPSLADMALKYLKLDLSAEKKGDDIWRLKYGTLDGVPFGQWPEAARKYALDDAIHTYQVFEAQGGLSAIQPTEQMQVQAAVVLQGIGVWGFAVNQSKREVIQGKLEAKAKTLHAEIDKYEWTGKGSQAKMMKLVADAWNYKHLLFLKTRCDATGIPINPVEVQQALGTVMLREAIKAVAETGAAFPGIEFPLNVDRAAWFKETLKGIPEIPMTKKGPSIAGEVLEQLGDVVPQFATYSELRHVEKMIENYITPYANETVHPSFVPLVTTGRTGCRTPNCFSDDTEVLTDNGWMPFGVASTLYKMGGIHILPRVAQWDSGAISFVHPTAWVHYNADKLVHITNDHIDLLVTEDHRCLLIQRKTNKQCVMSAVSYKEDYLQIGAGIKQGEDDPDYSDWFLRLCVAVQADGHWHDGGWSFSFRKKRKHERFNEIMKDAGVIECGSSSTTDSKGLRYRNRIYKGALASRLFDVLGGAIKLLPISWVSSLSARQMQVVGDESFLWDGLSTRKNNYSSSVEHNCDIMQAMYVMTGKRTNKRIYIPPSERPNYQCDITNRNYSLTSNRSLVEVEGPAAVSCCSVPSGFVVVRRNGKVMITGQCQNIPRKDKDRPDEAFRTMFMARKGRVLGTVDYSQLELCTLAATIRTMFPGITCTLGDAIDSGKDVHCITGGLIGGMGYEQMIAGKKAKDENVLKFRQGAKAANFGLPGGLGGGAFVGYAKNNYNVQLSINQAWKYINAWKRAWPEVPNHYLKYSADMVESSPSETFTSYTITGRPKAMCIYTEGSNYPFQGLAADGAKAALWAIWRECILGWYWSTRGGQGYGHALADSPLRQSRLVNFVHDEIVAEHPEGDAGKAALARQEALMVSEMTRICQNKIKISVEGQLSDAWEH
jgi:hypothetical protein